MLLKGKKVARFVGVRRFEIDPGCILDIQILVKEKADKQHVFATKERDVPLAVKITMGTGTIFQLSYVGTSEILELRSKEKAQYYLKQVEDGPNISAATKGAWKSAFACNQWGSFYLAISLLPFLDIIFGVIAKYKRF